MDKLDVNRNEKNKTTTTMVVVVMVTEMAPVKMALFSLQAIHTDRYRYIYCSIEDNFKYLCSVSVILR